MSAARRRGPRARLSPGARAALLALALYGAVAVLVWLVPALRFTPTRPSWAGVAGWLLVLVSLAVWVAAARATRAAYGSGTFPSTGLFALVRHPVYAAYMFVQCPGLVLWVWGWPALALPFAAYAVYRSVVRSEEAQLYERFGPAYEVYRRAVPALVPWPRRRPQPPAGSGLVDRRVKARKAAAARASARRGGKDRSDSHLRGL